MIRRAIRIRERDRQLVKDVCLYRVVRRDDIIKLGHFGSVARCNHRVSQLVAARVLRKLENVNGLTGHQTLFAPGVTATAILTAIDLPTDEVLRACTDREGPLLIEHALRVLDFRHRLNQECQDTGIRLTEWLCEPECLHEFDFRAGPYAAWKTVIIKPDASFCVELTGQSNHYFLEADLGHVSLPRFAEKLRRYENYLRSGAYRDAYGSEQFSVLTVTVGERRLTHLTALPCSGFDHFVTTWGRIETASIFNTTHLYALPLEAQLHESIIADYGGVGQ